MIGFMYSADADGHGHFFGGKYMFRQCSNYGPLSEGFSGEFNFI